MGEKLLSGWSCPLLLIPTRMAATINIKRVTSKLRWFIFCIVMMNKLKIKHCAGHKIEMAAVVAIQVKILLVGDIPQVNKQFYK